LSCSINEFSDTSGRCLLNAGWTLPTPKHSSTCGYQASASGTWTSTKNLLTSVQEGRFKIILIDIDEVRPGLTPDYESAFVRELLESFGATVLNAFTDDGNAFSKELKARCGQKANEDEITDGSDIVNFFPSLAGDIVAAALRKELDVPMDELPKDLNGVFSRIESLKKLRPYSGGGIPFVEDRLSREWRA